MAGGDSLSARLLFQLDRYEYSYGKILPDRRIRIIVKDESSGSLGNIYRLVLLKYELFFSENHSSLDLLLSPKRFEKQTPITSTKNTGVPAQSSHCLALALRRYVWHVGVVSTWSDRVLRSRKAPVTKPGFHLSSVRSPKSHA